MIEPKKYVQACIRFRDIFGVHLNEYMDTLGFSFNKAIIDIIKFDDWLQNTHPYNSDVYSMEDVIEKYYGKKGVTLIKELL